MDNFDKLSLEEKINHEDVIANAKAQVRMYKQGYSISFCDINYLHFLVAVYNEISKELNLGKFDMCCVTDSASCRKIIADFLNLKMKELEKIEFVAPNLD